MELTADMARGKMLSDNPYVTQACTAKAVGALEVYHYLLTMTEEDLNAYT